MLFKNLILVVFLAIAISISSLFLPVKVNHAETPSEQETSNNSISATLTLDYDATEGELKPTPNLGSFDAGEGGYWDITKLTSIRGGMNIRFLVVDGNLQVQFGSQTQKVNYAQVVTPEGYRLKDLSMGNKIDNTTKFIKRIAVNYDGDDFIKEFVGAIASDIEYIEGDYVTIDGSEIECSISSGVLQKTDGSGDFVLTPEDLDPEYNKTLKFHVTFEPISYKLYMHHKLANGSWSNQLAEVGEGDEDDYVQFNIKSNELVLSNYAPAIQNVSADQTFISWGLDVSDLEVVDEITTNVGYKSTPNRDATKTDGTIEVKIDEKTYAKFNYTKIDTEGIYHISHLLAGSFGNFGYLENNDASSRPRIKARYARTYDVTIYNGGENGHESSKYWEGFTADDFDKNELVGVYVKDNAGAVAVNEDEIVDRSTATIKISAGVESPFMTTEINADTSRAFLKYNDFKGNDAYSISVPSGSYAVYNYGHEITGWNVTVDGSTLNFDWETKSLGDLAAVFDNYGTAPENIVITPIWQEIQKIIIKYGVTTSLGEMSFGGQYDELSKQERDGQTMINYKVGSNVIALAGAWNYYNISAENYVYDGESYTITLDGADYLDNVYKVSLVGAKNDIISNVGYTKATTTYASHVYEPTNFLTLDNYSGGLIDVYVSTTLADYKTAYEEKIDGDGTDDHEILRKVYGGDKDNLYIYLVNNHAVGDLPTYDTPEWYLTAWTTASGEKSFHTTNYDSAILKGESLSGNGATKWEFSDGALLNANYWRKKFKLSAEMLLEKDRTSSTTDGGYVELEITDHETHTVSSYIIERSTFKWKDDEKEKSDTTIIINAGSSFKFTAKENIGYAFNRFESSDEDGKSETTGLFGGNAREDNPCEVEQGILSSQNYNYGDLIKLSAYFTLINYDLILNYQDLVVENPEENKNYTKITYTIESETINLVEDSIENNVNNNKPIGNNADAHAFGGWILRDCSTDSIIIDRDEPNKTIVVYCASDRVLKFKYDKLVNGKDTALGDENVDYYYITYLITGSYGDFNETYFQGGQQYYNLYAKWSYLYNVTVDNSEGYWNGKLADSSFELMGVTIYKSGWVKGPTGTIQILYSSGDHNNQFMSTYNGTTSLAFKKASEITSYAVNSYEGKYAVYNYGHAITGWTIYVKDGAQKQNYLVFDSVNKKWALNSEKTVNAINKLIITDQNDMAIYLESLAGFIDDYYLENHLNLALTMVPEWKTVEISATVSYDTYSNETIKTNIASEQFYFGEKYVFDEQPLSGKKQVFVSQDSKKVALAGNWNYTTLSYVYENAKHKIELVANKITSSYPSLVVDDCGNYVDNIYKIKLTEIKPQSDQTYTITNNSDYSFANALVKAEDVQTMAFDKFENSEYSAGFIDDYIDDLKELIGQYEENIDGDGTNDFEILRKVYATNGSANGKSFTTNEGATCEFYMYLANGQLYGNLPTIDTASSQLIFYAWQKSGNNGRIYFTENYSDTDSDHIKVFEENNNGGEILSDDDNVWTLAETGYSSGTDIVFKAYYAGNKFVYVDVNTILGEEVGKYGYALIYVDDRTVDNSKDAKYLVVYNNDPASYNQGMQYYSLDVETTLSLFKLMEFNFEEKDPLELVTVRETMVSPIKWYVGSVLEIYVRDQSQDVESMNSGNFDDMIGYKFSSITATYDAASNQTPNPVVITDLLTNDESNSYVKFANREFIEDNTKDYITTKPFESASVVTLNIAFEMLNYSFEVKLDDSNAGSFTYSHRGVISSPYTETTINNVQVGNTYLVNYVATVGYEFKTNAFVWVINGVELVALTYSSDNITSQSYSFTIDGSWLRENYYAISNTDYRVDYKLADGGDAITDDQGNPTVKIGSLKINTKPIEFSYGVKVYDSTQIGAIYPDGIIATEVNQYVDTKLIMNNGKMGMPGFSKLLLDHNGMWVYNLEDKPYAILNSRMFFPRNLTTQSGNNFTEYDFLWTVEYAGDGSPISPTTSQEIDTMVLLNMVNAGAGAIVPLANRTLYMMIEVRELYSIEMVVKVHETQDTNSTERSTILTNAEDNSFESVVGAGADKMCAECGSETHTCLRTYFKQENGLISTMAYTYKGLKNTLTSDFDNNRYQGVNYYQNGIEPSAKLENAEFECEGNTMLYIEYVPNELTAQLKFFVDGSEKTQNQITADGYLNLLKIPQESKTFVLNDIMEITYQIANEEYDVETKVSGAIKSATQNNGRYTLLHQIVDADYNTGVIVVEFLLRTRPSSSITVKYQLYDNNQSMADDDYGTFKIMVGGVEKIGSAVDVMEGKSLKIDISGLSAGYEFHELRHNNLVVVEPSISGKVITITDSYVPGNASAVGNSGSYVIYIKKIELKVVLEKNSDLENWSSVYQIKDGQTSGKLNALRNSLTLSGLYVGKQINLVANEQNTERLKNFYYYLADKSNKFDLVDGSGNPSVTLKITSDLIADALNANGEICLGFDLVKKYKFDLRFASGRDLADDVIIKANGQDYISGTYVDEGSEISLEITTLVEGKYKIVLNGQTANKMDSVNETYTLNVNKTVVVDIIKTQYGISVEESVYDTIESLDQGIPSPVEVPNHVNGLNTSVVSNYGDATVLHIKRVLPGDRRLHAVKISGNDLDGYFKLSFNADGVESVWYNDGISNEEISVEDLESYGIKVSTITNGSVEYVKIEYIVSNVIELHCVYATFKSISGE